MMWEAFLATTWILCARFTYHSFPLPKFKKVLQTVIKYNNIYAERRRGNGTKVRYAPYIRKVYREDYGFSAVLQLPSNLPLSKLKEYQEHFELATNSTIEFEHDGRVVYMYFYQLPLNDHMPFNEKLLQQDGIVVGYSRKGIETIDFSKEAGAHILVAGATDMGKSVLLRHLVTSIILKTNGHVKMKLINSKVVDNLVFMDLPCVELIEARSHAHMILEEAIQEIEKRKQVLIRERATNLQELKEPFPRYFIVIDEFANYADDKEFKEKVAQIAERGRFVGVHLILAMQRPDGKDIIPARIKDNCLTKIALKMGTRGGSETIIGTQDAWQLPFIKGRAILYINRPITIQIPYMSVEQCHKLLEHLKGEPVHESKGLRDIGEFRPLSSHD